MTTLNDLSAASGSTPAAVPSSPAATTITNAQEGASVAMRGVDANPTVVTRAQDAAGALDAFVKTGKPVLLQMVEFSATDLPNFIAALARVPHNNRLQNWLTLSDCKFPKGANLTGIDLYYATLNRIDLSKANLSYADLKYTKLYMFDISDANITGADFFLSDIQGVNLEGSTGWSEQQNAHFQKLGFVTPWQTATRKAA